GSEEDPGVRHRTAQRRGRGEGLRHRGAGAQDVGGDRLRIVSPIRRDTTSAMYITPAKASSITSARAAGRTGRMSVSPTPESVLKLRNSSSVQLRGRSGSTAARKLPGKQCWHAA